MIHSFLIHAPNATAAARKMLAPIKAMFFDFVLVIT
jgi:hypothetical protein